jgi:hypothetical protein
MSSRNAAASDEEERARCCRHCARSRRRRRTIDACDAGPAPTHRLSGVGAQAAAAQRASRADGKQLPPAAARRYTFQFAAASATFGGHARCSHFQTFQAPSLKLTTVELCGFRLRHSVKIHPPQPLFDFRRSFRFSLACSGASEQQFLRSKFNACPFLGPCASPSSRSSRRRAAPLRLLQRFGASRPACRFRRTLSPISCRRGNR